MRWESLSLLFFLLPLSGWAATADLCPIYGETYAKEIRPKVESGIPFELMTLVTQKETVLCRRVIHLTYNLWDEVITLLEGEQPPRTFPLKTAEGEICKNLECRFTAAQNGGKVAIKLLLNPMWAGRIARLQAALPDGPGTHGLVSIDWSKVAKDMPSEKELLVKEGQP